MITIFTLFMSLLLGFTVMFIINYSWMFDNEDCQRRKDFLRLLKIWHESSNDLFSKFEKFVFTSNGVQFNLSCSGNPNYLRLMVWDDSNHWSLHDDYKCILGDQSLDIVSYFRNKKIKEYIALARKEKNV